MPKLCKCGAIVEKKCNRCYPEKHDRTTTQRGYDSKWRRLSERVRQEQPLCPMCEAEGRAIAATEVHHVVPIAVDATRRLDRSNLVALCSRHHNEVEHRSVEHQTAISLLGHMSSQNCASWNARLDRSRVLNQSAYDLTGHSGKQ